MFHNQTTVSATSKPIPVISAGLVIGIQTFAESRGMPRAGGTEEQGPKLHHAKPDQVSTAV